MNPHEEKFVVTPLGVGIRVWGTAKAVTPNSGPRAFTLIELLIVVGMLGLTTGALVDMIGALTTARNETTARIDASEAADRALRLWREDVAFATRIEAGADSRELSLVRPQADGADSTIRYALDVKGRLIRTIESPPLPEGAKTRTLAEDCENLEFQPVGRGWRMQWTATYCDGISRREWPQAGFATSLAGPTGGPQ